MKGVITFSLAALLCSAHTVAQPLAGTDDLGRVLLQHDAVGDPKDNRHVAMFYFLWQGDKGSITSPGNWNLDEIYTKHPEVFEDGDNPNWGGDRGTYYFWGRPIYEYYRGDDYWVHLRNIQLLTDAGVDLLVLDATNNNVYPLQSESLMKAIDAVKAQGKNPPRLVFYTNTESGKSMQQVYNTFYKEGAPYRHPDCWFMIDGKPLIVGVTKEAEGTDYKNFFTLRESQWPTVPQVVNGWPWISFTRKPEVHLNDKGEREIINVSVSQHPDPGAGMGGSAFYGNMNNWGRSYRNNSHGNPATDLPYGYNFQEQWEYALKEDVPYIFVTGWNEWIAGRWKSTDSNPKHSWFCDQASPEYSRDIEPTYTAGLKDNYYMQLVNNIRRYKGLEKNPVDNVAVTIKQIKDWEKVSLIYTDYTGDTGHRDHAGAQSKPATVYTNNTGRNDFSILKVAHDKGNLFFYAETKENITPQSGDNWMRLYIDWDKNAKTGWKGYDYRIVKGSILEQYQQGAWKVVDKKAVMHTVDQNKMMITLPLSKLGKQVTPVQFEFKWSDNMQQEDPLDWYVNGDAAPGGRFNYCYSSK